MGVRVGGWWGDGVVVGQGVMWVVVGGSEGWVGGGGGRRRRGERMEWLWWWGASGGGLDGGGGGVATAVACHPFSQTRHERGIFGFLLLNIPLGKT